jgi:hypothetical protein
VQTWEYDGVRWQRCTPSVSPQRAGRLVDDAARSRTVLVCPAANSSETWEWDGVAWTRLVGASNPPYVSAMSLAYDARRTRIVLCGVPSAAPAVWEWSGAWQQVPSAVLGSRLWMVVAFEPIAGRVLAFGGVEPAGGGGLREFDETREWDGAAWSLVPVSRAPSPRGGAQMIWDARRQRMLLLGGYRREGTFAYSASDVLELALPASFAASALGPGCGGSLVPDLAIGLVAPAVAACTFDVVRAAPLAPAVFGVGLVPQPQPLGAGCTWFVPPGAALAVAATNAAGFASTILGVPPSLRGASFVVQAGVLDASAPLGIALTRALQIVVGN